MVLFLALRGLHFRGNNEVIGSANNGNYLGTLELLSEYDPFLEELLKNFGNSGKGKPSYLSSTICNEFIEILGNIFFNAIISELKEARYYSISVDSTTDVNHVDQLPFVIRYVKNGQPFERFLQFMEIEGHKSEYLSHIVVAFLEENCIDLSNYRCQSYDNCANMAAEYTGLQARINEVNN